MHVEELTDVIQAEARAANTIRHNNIIDIFNFGSLDDGRHYFVMELLDGSSFEAFLESKGALEPRLGRAVRVIAQWLVNRLVTLT